MQASVWNRCVRQLRSDLSEQQFNTWIRPLQAVEDELSLKLLAPNHFVVDWVNENCIGKINELVRTEDDSTDVAVTLVVGTLSAEPAPTTRPAASVPVPVSQLYRRQAEPGTHVRALRRGQEQSAREGRGDAGGPEPG